MKKKLIIFDYDGVMVYSFLGSLAELFLELKRCRMRVKNPLNFLRFRKYKLVKGVDNIIRNLCDNDCTIAIVSSNKTKTIKRALKKYNLEKCINTIIGREYRMNKSKKIAMLLTKLKFNKNKIFYIGDTIGDIVEAKKAGIKSIAASWGYHKKKYLVNCSPDILLDKPRDLIRELRYDK